MKKTFFTVILAAIAGLASCNSDEVAIQDD